jgi:hydrogenase maturation protein HypF
MRTDLLMDAILSEAMTAGDNLAEKRRLAFNFHYFLAEMTAACAAQLAKDTGLQICALSGGVYQNTLLLYLTESALKREGLSVIRHHMIPPNDGGIAIGRRFSRCGS